jgi:hypothetical protein
MWINNGYSILPKNNIKTLLSEDRNQNGIFDNYPIANGGDIDGLDNDLNGFIDDVVGWNFYDDNNTPTPAFILNNHGTECAGILGAVGNNKTGIAGINYKTKIMAVRVANDYGDFYPSNVIKGLYYALFNGAKVINMSFIYQVSNITYFPELKDALDEIAANGAFLVASAGNAKWDLSGENARYPACHANVLAVGASNNKDEYADESYWGSNYGAKNMVMSPGIAIYTTSISGNGDDLSGNYCTNFLGTSASTPQVAGLASLILSCNPNLTNIQTRKIIELTSDTIDHIAYPYGSDHWNERYGYGRINAYKAVLYANDYTAPKSPVNLKVLKTEYDKIYLSWDHNVEPNTGGYKLYYGNSSGNYTNEIDIGYNNVCTLAVGDYQPYYIAIKAYSFLDVFSPSYSNEVFSYAGGNVRVQNNIFDAGQYLYYGTVNVNGTSYSSPYAATWAKNTAYHVGASNSYYYGGATRYFCTWSDDGNILHDILFPGNSTYDAYYLKSPLLQGDARDNDIYSLYWTTAASLLPNFKEYRLSVWKYTSFDGEKSAPEPEGWWSWETIYTGTEDNYIHQLTTDQVNRFMLSAVFNNGYIQSNILIVEEDNPDDPIVSETNSTEATAYSNGKKIIVDSEGKIHTVYVNGDIVYYTTSIDDGETWSAPIAVGTGKHPAIELTSDNMPTVCWNDVNNLYSSKMVDSSFEEPQLIYTGPEGSEISYLSYVLDQNTNNSYLGWVDEGTSGSSVLISTYNPSSSNTLIPTPIDQGGSTAFKSPSLCLDKSGDLKIAWSHTGMVYYKDSGEFTELGQNGIHPIVDVYGDKTSVVWQEEVAPGIYQVVKKTKGINGWSEKQVISYPDGQNADFPVVAAAGQYVYSKNVKDNDYDLIYNCEYDNGWLIGTQNLSGAQGGISRYPSIAFKQEWPKSKLYVLWTEEMPIVKAGAKAIASYIKSYTMTVDPVPCNYIDVGIEEYDSYNLQKMGTYYYGQQPEYTIDYHPTELKYGIQNLDPTKKYRIKVVYYQETDAIIKQTLSVDNTFNAKTTIKPKTVVTEEHWIPNSCLKDGQVEVTITKTLGEYAVCSVIALYEYARDCDGKSTADISGSNSKTTAAYSYELMQNYPNPNTGKTAIKYQLAQPGKVSLKIYNTLGQVVKTLVSQEQPAGIYNAIWDGRDNTGKAAANGVYFYRLESGSFKATKKMVVLK